MISSMICTPSAPGVCDIPSYLILVKSCNLFPLSTVMRPKLKNTSLAFVIKLNI
uniref:Uncharacterized protein n=1 Tax=Rhizophora mucronata TaxID=61149 RepID=A0A2P2Q6Z1_RHIMU